MNRISLHCSSYVARESNYNPTMSWDPFVADVNKHFQPLDTYEQRFDELIRQIQGLGYDAVDVWEPGQLNWRWATDEHIRIARDVLARHEMTVTSYAGEFGRTREEFLAACRVANGINAPILSGTTEFLFQDRDFVIRTLKDRHLQLAVENHPETSAKQLSDQVGDGGDGTLGVAVDTGWFLTRNVDVLQAVRELGKWIIHIHLKDVLPGPENINVGLGKGAVPMHAVVQELRQMGYVGDYSIENEGLDHDPSQELADALVTVRRWLSE